MTRTIRKMSCFSGKLSWLACLLFLTLVSVEASAAIVDLGPRMEIFEGSWEAETPPDDIHHFWQPTGTKHFATQKIEEPIWLRAKITDSELSEHNWLLLHPFAQRGSVYLDGKKLTTGEFHFFKPINQREIPHHFLALSLPKPQATENQDRLLQIRIDPFFPVNTFFKIADQKALVQQLSLHSALGFGLLAIIAIMAIYNLFLYFSIRDSVYLWYVAASCASFAYSAVLTNISAYVISDFGMPPKYGVLAGCSAIVAQLMFFQRLLETKATFPKIDRLMTGAVIVGTGLIAISPWLSHKELVTLMMLLSTVSYIGILVVASLRARAGYRPALYFLLGWVPFIVSLFITMSEYAGFIEPTSWVSYLYPAGLSWEMAIFSLALASRIKILRDERDTLLAQQIEVSENARRTLERSNQIKDDFLNAVSHELRTPLHTIQGQLDLLREAPLNGEQNQAYRLIEYANLRMTRQVGGILDFVDAQDDSLLSSPQVFVPASLFELLEYEFLEPARAKPVSLAFSLDENVPGKIYMDGLMLEKVLYQLIDNAIKFTPSGGHIFVKGQKAASENTLVLRISDTGPGIPDNQREKVFQAFSQGESGLTRRYGGVGLGLPLANALSHALGGAISILRSSEEGTTLEVIVPYGKFHESGQITPEADQGKELHRSPRVLVVEDDAANRMIIRKQLEQMGVLFEGVQNGLEAVEAAMKEPWDLIIMDCQMPVMDGIEATREIRLKSAQNLDTAIIALTANASESYRKKCLEAGMDEYCTKPLRMDSLRKLVGKYAHTRNKERYKEQQGLKA